MNDFDKIFGLLLIIVILIILTGVMIFNPFNPKEACNVEIVSVNPLYVGGSISVSLTDSKNHPISNQTIHVTIMGNNGQILNRNITTDSSGKGTFQLNDISAGEYKIVCNAGGDGKYLENSTTQQITINNNQQTTSHSSGISSDGYSYYPEYGPAVDSHGVTRKELLRKTCIIFQ